MMGEGILVDYFTCNLDVDAKLTGAKGLDNFPNPYPVINQLMNVQSQFATGDISTSHLRDFIPGATLDTDTKIVNSFAELLAAFHQYCFDVLSKAKFDRKKNIGSRTIQAQLCLMTFWQQTAIEAEGKFMITGDAKAGLEALGLFVTICVVAQTLQEEYLTQPNDSVQDSTVL